MTETIIDSPQPSVCVAGVERLVAVAQTVDGRRLGELTRQVSTAPVGTIPASHKGVGHHQGNVIGVRPSRTLDGDRDVGQRHVIITHTDLWSRTCNVASSAIQITFVPLF